MSLIVQALGSSVQSTIEQLTALGMSVPENIQAVAAAMEHVGEVAVQTASQFEQAVQQMMGSITSFADNSDVLEEALKRSVEKGTPFSLIIDALGSTIEKTVTQLKALGIDVPPTIQMLSNEMLKLGKSATEATKALKSGPNAVELVQMRISAYNSGFEVGQLVHSPNASRYNFTGVPKMPAFTEKTVVASNSQPTQNTAQVTIGTIQEGNIYITQTPDKSDSDVIAELKDALAHNRSNLKTDFQRAMKETQNAPTPPGVM